MIDLKQRKAGGGKLSRSETVTVRLDPKLRYLAELAARKQRRTLSSFIEWAIEDVVGRVNLYEGSGYDGDNDLSIGGESAYLWDVDDSDRFVKLALRYPQLLTHDEQVIWKLIKENGYFWYGHWQDGIFEWSIEDTSFLYKRLRDNWDIVKQVASGEKLKSNLPSWNKYKKDDDARPLNAVRKTFDSFDDDLPF
ncbi:hypothetical protein SAMN05216302_101189 [Nitrosomonas aestuarii]|uniref:Uncharacterized protein n=1 Tax=Nitrosomonas aestuarii TaxID=52441 RepID=A0A1I4B8H2_9PROT|nr:hypothetical protein [Nitrosomonas aestuarii]SFK65075.1 hypothetical protein SAMN05216302_101189 [Nitrosomonas aestuarii]